MRKVLMVNESDSLLFTEKEGWFHGFYVMFCDNEERIIALIEDESGIIKKYNLEDFKFKSQQKDSEE